MKFRATKKEIMNGYEHVIAVRNEELRYLLTYETPIAYIARTEGWAADVYENNFRTAAIVTGYAAFGTIRPTRETNDTYNQKAYEIVSNYNLKHEIKIEMLRDLLDHYFKTVTEEARQ